MEYGQTPTCDAVFKTWVKFNAIPMHTEARADPDQLLSSSTVRRDRTTESSAYTRRFVNIFTNMQPTVLHPFTLLDR